MGYQMIKIEAEGKIGRKKEKHCLLWEKGNVPCKKVVLKWFKDMFGGLKWKLLGSKKFTRKSDFIKREEKVK